MRTQQPCRIKSNRIERAQVPLKKKQNKQVTIVTESNRIAHWKHQQKFDSFCFAGFKCVFSLDFFSLQTNSWKKNAKLFMRASTLLCLHFTQGAYSALRWATVKSEQGWRCTLKKVWFFLFCFMHNLQWEITSKTTYTLTHTYES